MTRGSAHVLIAHNLVSNSLPMMSLALWKEIFATR